MIYADEKKGKIEGSEETLLRELLQIVYVVGEGVGKKKVKDVLTAFIAQDWKESDGTHVIAIGKGYEQ